jgi:hypothetical protein
VLLNSGNSHTRAVPDLVDENFSVSMLERIKQLAILLNNIHEVVLNVSLCP